MSDYFDRELGLDELLPASLLAGLGANLVQLLGAPLALLDAGEQRIWGEAPATAARYPLVTELEPIGFVATAAPAAQATTATRLLVEFLMMRRRYLMASYLHTEAVTTGYAELSRQAAALETAEDKLHRLNDEIDTRIATVKRNQRQIYHAERLATVAQLAAGIAHEINNPLGFLRSNLNTLGKYLTKISALRGLLAQTETAWREQDIDFVLEDGVELIKDCVVGLDRIARIVTDLSGFSGADRPEEVIADINGILRDACDEIEQKKPAGVRFVLDAGVLTPLLCLPGHLRQVFLNLLTNALQAVGENGAIHAASRLEEAADGEHIVVSIRDNGSGIEARHLPHVCDPFFTTRPVGQGTGLGLTVARDIVQAHSGSLGIESTPGADTLVTVRLPT